MLNLLFLRIYEKVLNDNEKKDYLVLITNFFIKFLHLYSTYKPGNMAELDKTKRLKKELNLLGVFAITAGTTLSGGFFLLPGLAAMQAGHAIVLAYLVAAIPLIPAMFSLIELSTAMPRAGGIYYFLDRTLGPYFGTIGGIGTWLALVLKVAFALIGMGAYISIFAPNLEIVPIAIILAIALGILNIFGTKQSGSFQVILVFGLLIILIGFVFSGLLEVEFSNLKPMFDVEVNSIISTAGLVYISYAGITKVASLAEEVKNPEKNLPRGVMLAIATSIIIYIAGTMVMAGVVPMDILKGDLTPAGTAAEIILGKVGLVFVSIAAIFAFISVANAGIMSSSRYPLAMSRDHLMPKIFRKLVGQRVPVVSIVFTVVIIIALLILFDPLKIAKLASAFQLLMFALVCLAVIVMRESRIESYDPGYKSPLYPWMQIIGIIVPLFLIFTMGIVPILFTIGLIILASLWYKYYAKNYVVRTGAIFHIFERLGKERYEGLDRELRGILKEKGLRQEDPFEDIVTRSIVLDLADEYRFEEVVDKVAERLSENINHSAAEIKKQIFDGTKVGATPVTKGVALPHFRSDRCEVPHLALVRSKKGTKIKLVNPLTQKEEEEETVTALFFLVSPEKNPSQHLRILAQIAGRVDDENFSIEWNSAADEQELKEVLLHDEKFLSITVSRGSKIEYIIDKPIRQIELPKGCLIALLRRDMETIIPNGDTIINEGDRLTIIGEPKSIAMLRNDYLKSQEPLNE